jgi:Flp pilus assembly pilin Flp
MWHALCFLGTCFLSVTLQETLAVRTDLRAVVVDPPVEGGSQLSFARLGSFSLTHIWSYKMIRQLLNDEAGFIISAELVLVATLLVIGLIVGLSEVQHAINSELDDVGNAIGKLNQSYSFSGFTKRDGRNIHAFTRGSAYADEADDCDCNQCDIACDAPVQEGPKR